MSTNFENQAARFSRQHMRRLAITEAVIAEGSLRIDDLADKFGISIMTVHRDLNALESIGLIRKERGLATAKASAFVESSDLYRTGLEVAEKEDIAKAALSLIEPGSAVMLDDSTTTFRLVRHLHAKTPLTVISNSLPVLEGLRGSKGISLLSLGGEFRDWCSAFTGGMTLESIKPLRTDYCVLSTSAITDDIAFHQDQDVIEVKKAMFATAKTRILLADHTKFEKRALHSMLPLTDFDVVIVDSGTNDEHIARLRDSGTNVLVAPRIKTLDI